MPPIYFHGNSTKNTVTLFFNIVTTVSCAFLLAMNKSLCATIIKIHLSGGDPSSVATAVMQHLLPPCALIHCWVSINIQQVSGNSLRGVQRHTFASYVLHCQTPMCQSALLLPSDTQQ